MLEGFSSLYQKQVLIAWNLIQRKRRLNLKGVLTNLQLFFLVNPIHIPSERLLLSSELFKHALR